MAWELRLLRSPLYQLLLKINYSTYDQLHHDPLFPNFSQHCTDPDVKLDLFLLISIKTNSSQKAFMCKADFAEGLERKEGEEVVNHHNNEKTKLQLILRWVFPKFLYWLCHGSCCAPAYIPISFFYLYLFIFNWMKIALQYCFDFCHTSTWIGHRCAYVPSPISLPLLCLKCPGKANKSSCYLMVHPVLSGYSF